MLFFWVDDRLLPKWLLINYLKSKWVARGKSHLASQQQHILKLKEIPHQPRPLPLKCYPKVQISGTFHNTSWPMPLAGLDLKAPVPIATTTSQTQGPTVLHLQTLDQVL